MMQVTFNVTGRDIVNALKAGKSVIVHAVDQDGYEEYVVPPRVAFNENNDSFSMALSLFGTTINLQGALDEPIAYNSGSSGDGGIK